MAADKEAFGLSRVHMYSVSVVRRIIRQMSDLEKSVGFRRISSHFV